MEYRIALANLEWTSNGDRPFNDSRILFAIAERLERIAELLEKRQEEKTSIQGLSLEQQKRNIEDAIVKRNMQQ